MKCPKCLIETNRKNGFLNGKQRYKCRECGRSFTKPESGRVSMAKKRRALQMYLEGVGFRTIGRLLSVSQVSVMRWIRVFGKEAEALRREFPPKSSFGDIAIDEMWHYASQKNSSLEYGLLLTSNEAFLLTSTGKGEEKREKDLGSECERELELPNTFDGKL